MGRRMERGFTLIELLIVVAIIGILAAIAIPGLLRARAAANEASTIGSLRAVNSSQIAFSSSCGERAYAATLVVLATPPGVGQSAFISPDLGAAPMVVKGGYTLTMAGTPVDGSYAPSCNGGALVLGYYATGAPLLPGYSGTRFMWTNTSGTIFTQSSAFASTNEFLAPTADPAAETLQ